MPKILLIEDDSLVTRMYQRLFTEDSGFQLIIAKDGQEGLKILKETAPDLILLDIIMPKIDGIEVLKRIKKDEETADIPVLMLTNLNEPTPVADAISLGARGYLVKSNYMPSEVMQQVKDILNI